VIGFPSESKVVCNSTKEPAEPCKCGTWNPATQIGIARILGETALNNAITASQHTLICAWIVKALTNAVAATMAVPDYLRGCRPELFFNEDDIAVLFCHCVWNVKVWTLIGLQKVANGFNHVSVVKAASPISGNVSRKISLHSLAISLCSSCVPGSVLS